MGYRIVRMSRELFEQMFVEGYTLPTRENERLRVTKGLPEGVKLVDFMADLFDGEVLLRFSHPSWEDAPRGERIPEVQIEFAMERTTEFHQWQFDQLTDAEKAEPRARLDAEQPVIVNLSE